MFPLVIDLPVAASSYNNHQQEGYIALIEFFYYLKLDVLVGSSNMLHHISSPGTDFTRT